MSASLERLATAFLSVSMPSGLEPVPPSMAWRMCLLRYKTANGTATTTGGLADWIAWASASVSSRSAFGQGSEPSWQKQIAANRVNRKKDRMDFMILLAQRRGDECDCVRSGGRLHHNLGNTVEARWKAGCDRPIAPGCGL